MQLTQKHEWLIDRYLRAVEKEMEDSSDRTREHASAHIRSKILHILEEIPSQPHRDEDLVMVFQQLGSPANQAAEYLARYGNGNPLTLAQYDRVWLGVCGGLGQYFNVQPKYLRQAAVAAGVLTGPIALTLYLCLYLEMYMNSAPEAVPRLNPWHMARTTGLAVLAALAMHAGVNLVPIPFEKLYLIFAPGGLPNLGEWNWLDEYRVRLLTCTLIVTIPASALAATPMGDNWRQTLRKGTKAVLSAYALILSAGLASRLAGLLLQFIDKMSL
jgi:phage shock protein PspC (stress-responsive transcriptional regulator)